VFKAEGQRIDWGWLLKPLVLVVRRVAPVSAGGSLLGSDPAALAVQGNRVKTLLKMIDVWRAPQFWAPSCALMWEYAVP